MAIVTSSLLSAAVCKTNILATVGMFLGQGFQKLEHEQDWRTDSKD